jgi:ABC-2 type transport system ATP-binding protein
MRPRNGHLARPVTQDRRPITGTLGLWSERGRSVSMEVRVQGAVVLEISNLSKRYGEVVALDGASFTVPRGRIVGFLGPNGAGKTTAMRSVFGLVRPDGGSITWDGEPIGSEQRLRFGYMPEERGLYPRMRLAEQLAYFGRLSGMTRADATRAASWWLARLGLSDRTDARLEQLSHGNQQRVQLAAALIHEPELAVLDEPFAGLDPLGVDSMGELMAKIVETGMSILFSSHQLDLVEDICQDVVIINRGRVVLAGEVRELRSASPIRRLELWVDDHPWHGWGDGQGVTVNGRPRSWRRPVPRARSPGSSSSRPGCRICSERR